MKEAKRESRPRPKPAKRSDTKLKGFGARLRELREKRGLTQQELARAVGAHWMLVSRYEREVHFPPAEKVVALAQVLRVSTDVLLRGDRSGTEPIEFKNIRLYERFRELDQLPKDEQETVLRLVDAVLAKHQFESIADRIKRSA